MINRCLTGAVLICVILLFRWIGRKTIPKRILCLLWIAAALYLLLPVRIPSALNFYGLFSQKSGQTGQTLVRTVRGSLQLSAEKTTALPTDGDRTGNRSPLALLYLAVCCAIALWLLTVYLCGLLRMHRGRPVREPFIQKWQALHPLRRPLRVLCSSRTAVPISGGILFPVILLPEDRGNCPDRELECILTHEYLHICHFDALWKLLFSACLCLFWFHPAVWAMVILAERDIEYACDEAVLSTGVRPKDYGASLIRMELRKAERPALTNAFTAGKLLKRVDRIRAAGGGTLRTWAVGLLAAAAILAVFATTPAAAAGADVPPAQPYKEERASAKTETVSVLSSVGMRVGNVSLHETELVQANSLCGAFSACDAYSSFPLLGERTGLTLAQVEAASRELQKACHPYLLRITSEEGYYWIRAYDFPEFTLNHS